MSTFVVIGGGPAGSTAAAILARAGHDVSLVEKERFPRHHVGESLQPAAFELLDLHLGLKADIAALGFQRKYGALYRWGENHELWSVLFDPRLEDDLAGLADEDALHAGGYDHAWHVVRERFDAFLLDHARSRGVKVVEGTVRGPLLEDGVVCGVHVGDTALRADTVLDASGQSTVLGRALGLVSPHADLKAVASYGYLQGDAGLPSALGRSATLIVSLPEGWIWWIPVGKSVTSVGFVTLDVAALPRGEAGRMRLLELAREAGLPVGEGATAADVSPLRVVRDWSYSLQQRLGEGWLAIGDAAGFVDPILSGGTDFAIRDACNAAIALLEAAEATPEAARARLAGYADRADREFRAYVKLARYWYGNNRSVDGFFWQARKQIAAETEFVDTPLRAFVYLTSGRYAADRHFKVFIDWQERRIFEQLGVDKKALAKAVKLLKERGRP